MPDWALVVVIGVVVIFGASKLPEIARNLGRSSGEFKRGLKEGDEEAKRATTPDAPASPTPTPPAAAPVEPPPNDARPGSAP
jgi:sec-independent protein translocase protein TatA